MARWIGSALLMACVAPAWSQPADRSEAFEKLVKGMVGTLERISQSLAEIKDRETADAARPILRKSGEDFLALRKQAETLPPPPKEVKDRLAKLYRGKLEAVQKKILAEVVRVQRLPGGREALEELGTVLGKEPKKRE